MTALRLVTEEPVPWWRSKRARQFAAGAVTIGVAFACRYAIGGLWQAVCVVAAPLAELIRSFVLGG